MPVEFQVDSLDTVDESLRTAYVEKDGKFTLDVDKYAEISPKTQGLRNKKQELERKLNEAKTGLKRFEKFAEIEDLDVDELLDLYTNKDKQPDRGKEPPVDEKIAQLEKAHRKALEKLTGDKTALETAAAERDKKLKYYELTVPVRDAALKAGVLPEDIEIVLLDTQTRFRLNDEGKVIVVDQDGDAMDITPQKFFESLYKEQRPKFYAASGASGSGAPGNVANANGKKAMRRADWDKLLLSNPAQAGAFIKEVREGKASLVD
jgi:hypothetical protein